MLPLFSQTNTKSKSLDFIMSKDSHILQSTQQLIDDLKAVCAANGLGNDGNEYRVITQSFLYKFLNDGFLRACRDPLHCEDEVSVISRLQAMSEDEYSELIDWDLPPHIAKLKVRHLVSSLYGQQSKDNFDAILDNTLEEIATLNSGVFSVHTTQNASVKLFDKITQFISDPAARPNFARAVINKLARFSFADAFSEGYDFFSTIFEYLIRDYNTDAGGTYAEYFTPHSVGRIMADILVDDAPQDVTCYDPSAGSGTLLMCLAHRIGQDKCTVFSQDISQKSSGLLRLNLILNALPDSLQNVIQGNTLLSPAFHEKDGSLKRFDYIVSNPPFKLDFSEYRDQLDTRERKYIYFAGVPKVPNKKREKMAIYLCFLQHVIASLGDNGKAAVVVPSGFLTAGHQKDKIAYAIRKQLVETKWLRGVVSMPPNIFAATTTSVSVIFIDKKGTNERGSAILIDATQMGIKEKDNNNKQYTRLSHEEEERIIDVFKGHQAVDSFAVVPSYDEMREKSYSFSAGQYFEVRIEHVDITPEEFKQKLYAFMGEFTELTEQSVKLDEEIKNQMKSLLYE